jgi:hypothetical protein
MGDFISVFFHEVGHFVANSLNNSLYGCHPVKHFIIKVNADKGGYQGEVKLDKPESVKSQLPSIEKMPQTLASLAYGSMFQAVFTGDSLGTAIGTNGSWDYRIWDDAIRFNGLDDYRAQFTRIEDDHFQDLKHDRYITGVFRLTPAHYTTRVEDLYWIDMEKLQIDLSDFLNNHIGLYTRLIEAYQETIEQGQQGN